MLSISLPEGNSWGLTNPDSFQTGYPAEKKGSGGPYSTLKHTNTRATEPNWWAGSETTA